MLEHVVLSQHFQVMLPSSEHPLREESTKRQTGRRAAVIQGCVGAGVRSSEDLNRLRGGGSPQTELGVHADSRSLALDFQRWGDGDSRGRYAPFIRQGVRL